MDRIFKYALVSVHSLCYMTYPSCKHLPRRDLRKRTFIAMSLDSGPGRWLHTPYSPLHTGVIRTHNFQASPWCLPLFSTPTPSCYHQRPFQWLVSWSSELLWAPKGYHSPKSVYSVTSPSTPWLIPTLRNTDVGQPWSSFRQLELIPLGKWRIVGLSSLGLGKYRCQSHEVGFLSLFLFLFVCVYVKFPCAKAT